MNLFYRSILPLFVFFSIFGVFLAGCLDAPEFPDDLQPIDSISIMVQQKDSTFSTILKVYPSDSATIKVAVTPEKIENDLKYEWYYSSNDKDELLTCGKKYSFYPNHFNDSIPNKLIIKDKEGNKQAINFTIVINTPPVLSDSTIPANGDTLYGSKESAFLFAWYSLDNDFVYSDTLFHTLQIDDKFYDVGTLLQIKQSGLKAGEHKFRIIVRDLYGDTDTLAFKKFYVIDTLEAK